MRRRFMLVYGSLVAVVIAAAFAWVVHAVHSRPSALHRGGKPLLFTVGSGESFSSVVRRLSAEHLLRRPRVIVIYAWFRGWDHKIKAGTYELSRGESARNVIGKLVSGDVFKVAITVPEGFRFSQISRVLQNAALVDSTAWKSLLGDPGLLTRLRVEGPSLEGYLFPDTYYIPPGTSAESILEMMRCRLDDVLDARALRRAKDMGMSPHEVLTLASIVQAETRLSEELALVSAVYHNRLRHGMKLEADPTVAYALGGYRDRLYYKDLETDSPFNTYRHGGLPPGPICAPGKAAIHAALHPDTTCKALYFVARGDGGHIFSLTLDDHLKAIESARKAKDFSSTR